MRRQYTGAGELRRIGAYPQHFCHRGAIDVGIQHPDTLPAHGIGCGQVDGERALPDTPFAADHGHDVAYASEAFLQTCYVLLYLRQDIESRASPTISA